MNSTRKLVPKEVYLRDAGYGNVPAGWTVVQIREILAPERGLSVGVMYPGQHDDLGVPLIKAGDLAGNAINPRPDFMISKAKHEEYRRTELVGDEVLITLVGDIGQCAVTSSRHKGWNTARAVAVLRLADTSDVNFVRICFLSRPLQHLMDVWSNTTVQQTLNLKEIRELPIPWPPKRVRDEIAEKVSVLDAKIELNDKMNETLEEMARAIFKSWFVDFDPVRAKMDGRKPVGMDAETAALFPDELVHVNGDLIPKGWKYSAMSDLIMLISGGTPKTSVSEYWNGSVPWFSVKDAPRDEDVFVIETEKNVTELGIEKSAAKVLPLRTTIISARGTVGKLAVTAVPMAMNQSCYGIRPTCGYGEFFTFYLVKAATGSLQRNAHGSVFDTITRQTFDRLEVVSPPPKVTEGFDKIVSPLMEKILINCQESRTLAMLRDALLPRLLSGEISMLESVELTEAVA